MGELGKEGRSLRGSISLTVCSEPLRDEIPMASVSREGLNPSHLFLIISRDSGPTNMIESQFSGLEWADKSVRRRNKLRRLYMS